VRLRMRKVAPLLVLAGLLGTGGCKGSKAAEPKPVEPAPLVRTDLGQRPPHPDYPTPAMAGTEELFLLEEPPRGPHVTDVKLPDRAAVRFVEHASCDVVVGRVVCSASRGKPGAMRWNVGRSGDRVVLAEHVSPSGHVLESYLLDWDPGGKLRRLTSFEEHGLVDWVRSFNPPGERYMERTLTGANNLAGCGFMAMTSSPMKIELQCLQWNGGPMRDTNGVSVTQIRFDALGFAAERLRLGLDHKPVAGHDGVHRTVYQRDAQGRVV